ncbi:GGDEF domain-containing protein [Aurantiacibacter xanthus]|uniref:diguanylate cyclase n=1 Tax=Aurantiacibacter xanthus TaxID=1784712 RepID=A0A3A1P7I4_9SPHN|nr:GGDEF domain-containing protein [Aurantiacibacter xanthus]RIV89716.1 GGDEF domain-containing protein [Aurantiacibacter xanthus]
MFAAGIAVACTLQSAEAAARCVGSEDPAITRVEIEIGRDPVAAVSYIAREIAETDPASKLRIAELYAAQTIALAMTGKTVSDAREQARRAAASLASSEQLRLFLRLDGVGEMEDRGEALQMLEALEREFHALPSGSTAKICRAIDFAYYFSELDRPREAFAFAAQAYRNSAGKRMSAPRAQAASMLGYFVSQGYDFAYAEQLHSEALKIELALGMSDLAANDLFLRGSVELSAGDWDRALRDFSASADQARHVGNAYAVAYAQLGTCRAALEGEALAQAIPACEQAYAALTEEGEPMRFSVTALMARLLGERGDAAGVLRLLDPLIANESATAQQDDLVMALDTRAQALAALNRNGEAYADLRRARQVADAFYKSELQSGITAMRARFQTEELQGNLAEEQRRSEARLWLASVVIAGAVIIFSLLGAIVFILLRHRRRFRHLAMTDPLTGLCNRRATLEMADEALRHSSLAAPRASLALIDIDHFKACNDRFGHDAGDQVLSVFARIVEGNVRPGDVVGRWGGEEFLLIAPGAKAHEAARIVERIREAAEQERFDFSADYRLRFSAGVARLDEAERMDECITLADRRLYRAKERGRNQTCMAGEEEGSVAVADEIFDPA